MGHLGIHLRMLGLILNPQALQIKLFKQTVLFVSELSNSYEEK